MNSVQSSDKFVAFADEFGNNSFNFQSQGTHFIVATIICKESYLPELDTQIENIRKKHRFQSGEIKSSGVGTNYTRRANILEDIATLDISIYAVVVNKKELEGEGFGYKKSFYKFVNNLLYKELFRTFNDLDLSVDEHGGNDFLIEFKKYVAKQQPRTLFDNANFNIVNSKNNKFIQIADFIAGTLGHIYDETKKGEHSRQLESIILPKLSGVTLFPKKYSFNEINESNIDNLFEPAIAQLALLRIDSFLETVSGTDQQKIDQINFLRLLQLYQRANVRSSYLTTKEILKHLNPGRPHNMNPEYFRTKVVGSLRDQGLLIASSRSGYKIPTSVGELKSFINHGKRVILPMVNRLKEARKAIKLATGNELDLLDSQEFYGLKKLLDA